MALQNVPQECRGFDKLLRSHNIRAASLTSLGGQELFGSYDNLALVGRAREEGFAS